MKVDITVGLLQHINCEHFVYFIDKKHAKVDQVLRASVLMHRSIVFCLYCREHLEIPGQRVTRVTMEGTEKWDQWYVIIISEFDCSTIKMSSKAHNNAIYDWVLLTLFVGYLLSK